MVFSDLGKSTIGLVVFMIFLYLVEDRDLTTLFG